MLLPIDPKISVYPGVTIGMLPEKVLARKSDTINLHWSVSKLESENQERRWSGNKIEDSEYDISSLDWSTDPNICFKRHQSGDPRQVVSYVFFRSDLAKHTWFTHVERIIVAS